MKKKISLSIVMIMLLVIFSPVSHVYAVEEINGDKTYEEGAEVYVPTTEDIAIKAQKEKEIRASKMLRVDPEGTSSYLEVTVFQQQNGYYCGPATVKQVLHYLKGSSSSQSSYASALGTTSAGTYMTKIASYLKSQTGRSYIYSSIGTLSEWREKVKYSITNKMPAVLDINTKFVSAFPYRSIGHFVNTSGYSTLTGSSKVRISDPYGPGLGNIWYYSSDVYDANNNHVRKAIIW